MNINTNLSIISSSVQIADDSICDKQAGPQEPVKVTDPVNEVVVDKPEEENKEKGVLRLLREGHFKGVADVRLRINFQNEISAIEREQLIPIAEEKVSGLIESISSEIDNYPLPKEHSEQLPAGINNLSQEFNSNVSQILDDFRTAETPDKDNLITQIRVSFDELKSGLEASFNDMPEPPIDEQLTVALQSSPELGSTDDTVSIETENEPQVESAQTIFRQFIAQLTNSFETELNKLETALTDIEVLPELSEPHGNGKAYNKFLEIYNRYNIEVLISDATNADTTSSDATNGDAQSRIDPPVIDTIM